MDKKTFLRFSSWALMIIVLILAAAVWASERLDGGKLSSYDLFPLFGLGAFSIMWTHYVLGWLRRRMGFSKNENKTYFNISSIVVLFMILLHPAILIAQLNKDGFGLPPASYLNAYPESKLILAFGTISLCIFLLFELKKWLSKKPWWSVVEWAQVAAMVLVFFHGLSLGRELGAGWYRVVWFIYGISFLAAVGYNYLYDKRVGGSSGTKER